MSGSSLSFENKWALIAARKLLDFVGRGPHTFVYQDRVNSIRAEIDEMLLIYYGWRPRVMANHQTSGEE